MHVFENLKKANDTIGGGVGCGREAHKPIHKSFFV